MPPIGRCSAREAGDAVGACARKKDHGAGSLDRSQFLDLSYLEE